MKAAEPTNKSKETKPTSIDWAKEPVTVPASKAESKATKPAKPAKAEKPKIDVDTVQAAIVTLYKKHGAHPSFKDANTARLNAFVGGTKASVFTPEQVKLFGNYAPEHVGKWMINKYDELAKKEAVKKPAAKSPAVKPTTTATPAATAA